ncbi:hypothetical protein CASFOL_032175 [Castilleja foliolosa]|uniref:Glycosyltransferase n=1 Tax=Castilleja foliolosa TaxID=1961234 RepID=A0ABD3C1M8_9LAMI
MSLKIENLHFILIPLMSQSHIIPITDFAKLLARHGVVVSIITTPLNAVRYKATVQSAQAQSLKIQMIPIKFPCLEAGLPDGCENMDALNSIELSRGFFQACEMLQGPLESLLKELSPKPSCIVSTNAIPWTQKVAEKFNIPRYNFETVSCFTLLCSHNLTEVRESVDSESESFRVPNICHEIEFTNAQLPRVSSKNDSDDFQDVIDQIKQARVSARGTLVNSFQELEPWYLDNYRDVVGNVWSIGPVSLCNKENSEKSNRGNEAAIDEHYCLTWLDSMRPKSVIYACFGSLCRISGQQTKEIGLGLESSGFSFIWIIRKQDYSEEVEEWLATEGFDERVKGRGLVIRGWAPQVLILSHSSVGGFLTHCGWNSTLEGVCAGVPMITWPMFAEQFYNEKFIVSVLGIGVRVGVESCMNSEGLVKCDQVRVAIEKVMDESEDGVERRKKAKEIAKMAGNAVEEGASSFLNLTNLIQDVIEQVKE